MRVKFGNFYFSKKIPSLQRFTTPYQLVFKDS